jgi:hypothetical protein
LRLFAYYENSGAVNEVKATSKSINKEARAKFKVKEKEEEDRLIQAKRI